MLKGRLYFLPEPVRARNGRERKNIPGPVSIEERIPGLQHVPRFLPGPAEAYLLARIDAETWRSGRPLPRAR